MYGEKNAAKRTQGQLGGVDRVERFRRTPPDTATCWPRPNGAGSKAITVGPSIFLFSHQLVRLDRRGRIHLARGKTNLHIYARFGRGPSWGG